MSTNYKDIIKSELPDGMYFDSEGNEVDITAMGTQFDKVQADVNKLEKEIIVVTAEDEGLKREEEAFDIGFSDGKKVDLRRSAIIGRYRSDDLSSVPLIKSIAEAFTNGEVEVTEHFEDTYLTIKFVGTMGVPEGLEDLKVILREAVLAHVGIEYEFIFMTWDQFDGYNKTWDMWDALNLMWDEFEAYKE